MRARIRLDRATLEGLVSEALGGASCAFGINRGTFVTEFEVTSPCHFRVLVESLDRERLGHPVGPRKRAESAIGVTSTLGSSDPAEMVNGATSEFCKALLSLLPGPPWKGFGILGSRSEKKKWAALSAVS